MSNDLVAYSRAGDVFHYRWAARRCLHLIYPNAVLHSIVIEGAMPSETVHQGEYVIDLAEYSTINGVEHVHYYQLKHTTVQIESPFTLGDFSKTLTGFAKKFAQHLVNGDIIPSNITFTILTNRPIEVAVKNNITAISEGRTVNFRTIKAIRRYGEGLNEDDLRRFCSRLRLEDGHGNYNVQRDELRIEMNQLIVGSIENAQMNNLTTLMQDKVMPDSDGIIKREDVLLRFGVTSERDLYPAPAVFSLIENIIVREAYSALIPQIQMASEPIVIHAGGGIGKSVFCQQLLRMLPEGWFGIAYDCFGAGGYRNRSTSRHRHRDALVQVANELASHGLCAPMIVHSGSQDKDIMRTFIARIEVSVLSLRRSHKEAQLVIIFDAADNAEMAASELGDSCFAKELLREVLPDGCKLVFSCRTERVHLLQPGNSIHLLSLVSFSQAESLQNLRKQFPDCEEIEGAEFHRLTSGNPRVQANALETGFESVDALLKSLGPSGVSVDEQIAHQLHQAIGRLKNSLPHQYHENVNAICLGLASLPPYIPIEVLATVSGIGVQDIRSFVADIGRPLWITDSSVQFRDEPTETWFRNSFTADPKAYEMYVQLLEPIATQFTYVASVLPQLYLNAKQYSKLIEVALSDQYLPLANPIDTRNVRVYRLQFAFKAALRLSRYQDAPKLAMRAGEEVAGDHRQFLLMRDNIDLLVCLQSKEKIQEIAFKRLLRGAWNGSENVYAAALLSGIKEFHGEASGFLRAARGWLKIHYEQVGDKDDGYNREQEVSEKDILEIAYAYLNIHGVNACWNFLSGITPEQARFQISQDLAKKLIDLERYTEIEELILYCEREPYITVAITAVLMDLGHQPEPVALIPCLDLLCHSATRIIKPGFVIRDRIVPAIVSFLEACLAAHLSSVKILWVLRAYVPTRASTMVASASYTHDRTVFFKAVAIRSILSQISTISSRDLQPVEWLQKMDGYDSQTYGEFTELVDGLMPWYILRAQLINESNTAVLELVTDVDSASKKGIEHRYRSYDTLPTEIATVQSNILVNFKQGRSEEIFQFYQKFLQHATAFDIKIRLQTIHAANRLPHLSNVVQEMELSTFEMLKTGHDRGPNEISDDYLTLARAVVNTSVDDAGIYFNEAVTSVSKFGEELIQRWEALSKVAEQSATNYHMHELAYRFIRCAELVGANVSREKHWDRSDAVRICAKISPDIAIAALSRWRDRAVYGFPYNLMSLLKQLTQSGYMAPVTGWSLVRLLPGYDIEKYLGICLSQDLLPAVKQQIYDDAIEQLARQGANEKLWQKMLMLGEKCNLTVTDFVKQKSPRVFTTSDVRQNDAQENANKDYWNKVFSGVEIKNSSELLDWFLSINETAEETNNYTSPADFYKELINRIKETQLWDVSKILLESDDVNYYEISVFLSGIPTAWKKRVSFKNKWEQLIQECGSCYARELCSNYAFKSFVRELALTDELKAHLRIGIINGMAAGTEMDDATVLFGFVEVITPLLEAQQAVQVASYCLERFELHMEAEFGDGPWAEWLYPHSTPIRNIANLIWSVLGSPKSSERWCAAHCVRTLADFNCTSELEELIQCLPGENIGAFGGQGYIFYHLHAKQFLLMAFASISHKYPAQLKQHVSIFSNIALTQEHILIQTAAKDTALTLEMYFPGSIDLPVLQSLNDVGKPVEVKIVERGYMTESVLHQEGSIDTTLKFDFDWDFDRYWFDPLADVFCISEAQVEQIATEVIINDWAKGDEKAFQDDPRRLVWKSHSYQEEVWHHHGEYPRTDTLSFYLSYHSMLVVAAKLLKTMPVVKEEYDGDTWLDWLSHHWLTRNNGSWLADGRTALPIKTVLEAKPSERWLGHVLETEFVTCIKGGDLNDVWLNVKAGWKEGFESFSQSVSITSALVSPKTSSALMRALSTYSNPYLYHLPAYEDSPMDFNAEPFSLKGWILDRNISKGIDEQDPYADHIDYPFFQLADSIITACALVPGKKEHQWHDPTTGELVLYCEAWSSGRDTRDKEPSQSGMRLRASIPFLQLVCQTFACDIIFEVEIRKDTLREYRTSEAEYRSPLAKIFILSQDGILRTTTDTYTGETDCETA
ncbi:ATP-binding protein [Chitinophaga oryziterrae]|uniref:ATP-binding protein n=1 Tax=Chitinophaga oryziterrae TaxID=1031224 RepID=A0A6N8J5D4_9BACT|nr:ATP-binding protein [Chitinophaga oryziterrae]MVT39382.1 ATP-binding protein [Chitinophaga oryziterrae]